jgi:predicted DsbA family dithiol-disulfide isomerase
VDVEWWPFELHPEIPAAGRPRGPDTGRSGAMLEIARAAGIPMVRTSIVPNSRRALEAGEFARDAGPEAFDRLHAALFRAYFVEDRNIGDVDILADIAGAQGLDGDGLRAALADRRYAPRVDESIRWAVSRGLTATPTFLFVADKIYSLPGAQAYEVFQSVMARLGVPPLAGDGERTAQRWATPSDTSSA